MPASELSSAPVASFKAPLYVAWEITHHCNARCLHCYSSSGLTADRSGELSTEEALDVIDQLADCGLLVLAFSGGEPLLRDDWRTLVDRAIRRGLRVNIGTNGSTVTPRIADDLAALGVHSITVSLDSHDPQVHEQFRQLPGLFPRAVNAIRWLRERGLRVVVGFTPTTLNHRDSADVVRLAWRLGASAVNLSEYVPAGRGPIDLALSPRRLRQVLETWIALRERYRGKIDLIWHDCRVGMLVPPEDRRKYVGCGAGRLVARIRPDGTVTPCVFLPTAIGSLRETRFAELWQRSELMRRFRERSGHYHGNCGQCEHLSSCGGCRAVAYAYSGGDPLAGDPHCWIRPCDEPLPRLATGEALPI